MDRDVELMGTVFMVVFQFLGVHFEKCNWEIGKF